MSTNDPYQQYPGTGWNQPTPNPYAQPAPVYDAAPTGVPVYGTPPPFGAPLQGAGPAYGARPYGAPAYVEYGFTGFGPVFTYAPWGQRVGAYLLDSLALVPYIVGLVVMSATSQPGVDRYGNPTDQPTSTGALVFGVCALLTLGLWAWNRWVRAGRTGQSWGKQVVGLTLQRDVTGEPIGIGMAFVRDLAHYLDGIFYLGYLWPLWDGKRQTFSDKLTTSVVVR